MFIYNLQEMAKSLQNEYQTINSKIEHNGLKSILTISELEISIKNIESVKKLKKTKLFINPVFSTSFTPPIYMIFAIPLCM